MNASASENTAFYALAVNKFHRYCRIFGEHKIHDSRWVLINCKWADEKIYWVICNDQYE